MKKETDKGKVLEKRRQYTERERERERRGREGENNENGRERGFGEIV